MAVKTLPTINQVQLIDKYEFARVALDKNSETFVVYIATLETIELDIYLS